MANEHPFQSLFQSLGRPPASHAESVNRNAYERLRDILTVPVDKPGRCILLRAPRAGYGKTHLLTRVEHELGSTHEFVPLQAVCGSQIDASTVINDTLRRLLRPLPASGGLCVLDLVARRLFALALQPLVGSGEVPCQDREGALVALRTRPVETFDFHHENAVTAHWARENFEVLGQRLAVELSRRGGLSSRGVGFWVDALFWFASAQPENPGRVKGLADAVLAGDPGEGVLMERLESLLGLLALLTRVVLVADDLEGFSSDESAALRLASFLGSLRQSVERLDVILSLNRDIWESAFLPRLSGGLADRLSEVVVELEPLSEEEMLALLESRVPGLGRQVLEHVDRGEGENHARGLIRAAGVAWLRATAASKPKYQPEPVMEPAVESVMVEERKAAATEVTVVEDEVPADEEEAVKLPVAQEVFEPKVRPELAIGMVGETVADASAAGWGAETPVEEAVVEAKPVQNFEETVQDSPFMAVPADDAGVLEAETVEADAVASGGVPEPPAVPEPPSFSAPPELVEERVASNEAAIPEAGPFESVPASGAGDEGAAAGGTVVDVGSGSDEAPALDSAEGDRVDDLLKQFRERYGRGG